MRPLNHLSDDHRQFVFLMCAIGVYLSLQHFGTPVGPVYYSGEAPPRNDGVLSRTFSWLMIASGAAFAPPRWRDLLPLAVLATLTLTVVLSVATLLNGRVPGYVDSALARSIAAFGFIFVVNLVLLGMGALGLRFVRSTLRPG